MYKLYTDKSEDFKCKIGVEGTNINETFARLVIESKDVNLMFEGKIDSEEACLSVIDFAADVSRATHVEVKGLDRQGIPVKIEAEDLKAICLQHEIDHLNGILFIDHISSLKRSLYKKRLKKRLKESEKPI